MITNDKQVGKPGKLYTNTKLAIEAITGVVEGSIAYAVDTDLQGTYTGAAWVWGATLHDQNAWAAKGDLIVGTGVDTAAILTVGGNGEMPYADSTQATGIRWDAAPAGGGDVATDAIWDAKGDLAVGTGANTASKLTIGDNGTMPIAASGETTGIKWDMPFFPCNGRLTLTTVTPVTTADVTAATTVYFTPYLGDYIALYDGSNWVIRNFTEIHIDLTETQNGTTTNGNKVITGLTDTSQLIVGMLATGTGIGAAPNAIASIDSPTQVTLSVNSTASATVAVTFKAVVSLPHDIFAFDNAGTVKLEMVAWTNTTTRATALAFQNGVYVKNGATTRRYLGTICTTTTGGQTEDSLTSRFVWNYYNSQIRRIKKTGSASYPYTTGTWRQGNNTAANKIEVVIGVVKDVLCLENYYGAINIQNGIGINVTNANNADTQGINQSTTLYASIVARLNHYPALGYTYYAMTEYGASSGAINTTFFTGELIG